MTDPALLDLVHDAVIIRERDGRIVAWNRAAEQRYGHTSAEALGRNLNELLKTMYLGPAVDEALGRDGYWEGEVKATGGQGEVLLSSCRQKVGGNSRILEVHGTTASRTGTDLRLVIDHVPGLVSYISTDLRYRFANAVYEEWFGTPPEEVVGAKVEQVLGPEAFARVEPEMRRALSGEMVKFETFLSYARGRGKFVSVSYVPDKDERTGEVRGFVVLVEDITARQHAEQSLRESERQYRRIVETAHEGIWIIGPDARTVFANQRMAVLLGTTMDQLMGENSFRYVFEEELEEARRLFEIKMKGDREPFEFRLRRADGTPLWARISGVPMSDESGAATGLLGMFTDITAARQAEQALRESNAELEQFAYAAAHDLQEPLRVVSSYTELFLRRYVPGADPSAQQIAGFILNSVRHMQALVRDLLIYSRAVHEEPNPPGPFALDTALDQAIAGIEGAAPGAVLRIEREPLPQVIGEPVQLGQVFQNLLSNAIKYQRPGATPEIKIWAEHSASEWIINVRDNGIGFDPIYAERIFGLFKRLHRDAYPGTGVGLGICRRLIERHGGRIWAESEGDGRGATFRFTLRAAD